MNRYDVWKELDTCPFCGGTQVKAVKDVDPCGVFVKVVVCRDCGARSPDFPMETPNQKLIDWWNRRPERR